MSPLQFPGAGAPGAAPETLVREVGDALAAPLPGVGEQRSHNPEKQVLNPPRDTPA